MIYKKQSGKLAGDIMGWVDAEKREGGKSWHESWPTNGNIFICE